MASYKYPRSIEFREVLPQTATGKLLRRVLVEEELQQRKGVKLMASTLHLVDVNIENNIAIVQINNPPLNVLGKRLYKIY